MGLDLDKLEQRIVGVLVEKELTVPETYPLTVNALVAGCNQKNNREPQMAVEDYEVEGALRALMDRGWATRQEREGGRTLRYAHEARAQLGVEKADLALLAELLCRGPQSPAALSTRASRMARVGSPEEVEARLKALATRPVPYVALLPPAPRERAPRWCHLLDGKSPEAARAAAGEPPPTTAPMPPARPAASTTSPAARASGAGDADEVAALRERVESLEATVEDLAARLERLEGR